MYFKIMEESLIKEGGFTYIEKGEGRPIIILHGLMGGLSNFQGVFEYFPSKTSCVQFQILTAKIFLRFDVTYRSRGL